MVPSSARRWAAAIVTVAAAAAVTVTVAQADAPRTFTITPVHGGSHTGITASFSFTSSASDPCKTQKVTFTWDGAPWASAMGTAPSIYSHTCVATINATPPAGTGGGAHTIAATGALGLDTASTTFFDDDPPTPAPTAAPATPSPAPAGPSAPPSAAASTAPASTPSAAATPKPAGDLAHTTASPTAAAGGAAPGAPTPPGGGPSGPLTLVAGLAGVVGLVLAATPRSLTARRRGSLPSAP